MSLALLFQLNLESVGGSTSNAIASRWRLRAQSDGFRYSYPQGHGF